MVKQWNNGIHNDAKSWSDVQLSAGFWPQTLHLKAQGILQKTTNIILFNTKALLWKYTFCFFNTIQSYWSCSLMIINVHENVIKSNIFGDRKRLERDIKLFTWRRDLVKHLYPCRIRIYNPSMTRWRDLFTPFYFIPLPRERRRKQIHGIKSSFPMLWN